jgi:hypothetical protein
MTMCCSHCTTWFCDSCTVHEVLTCEGSEGRWCRHRQNRDRGAHVIRSGGLTVCHGCGAFDKCASPECGMMRCGGDESGRLEDPALAPTGIAHRHSPPTRARTRNSGQRRSSSIVIGVIICIRQTVQQPAGAAVPLGGVPDPTDLPTVGSHPLGPVQPATGWQVPEAGGVQQLGRALVPECGLRAEDGHRRHPGGRRRPLRESESELDTISGEWAEPVPRLHRGSARAAAPKPQPKPQLQLQLKLQ